MLNCNSQQRAEGLQEAFFPPPCSSAADRIQASSYTQQQILVPPAVVVVDAHSFQDSPNSSSQEIQSQDNLHHQQQQHKPAGSLINLQGFGGEDHHPMFGGTINVNHAHGGMGGLDLLGGLEPCDQHNVMKFADMDAWNSLQLAGPSSLSLHHHHAATTSYRNLLTSSSLMDQPLSLDYGAHSGSLNHVTCPGSAAMHSPTIYERGGMRMDTATTPRESADSSNSSQSFQSRLMSEPTMNLNLHHSSGGGGGGIPLHIRKGISFDTGLGLNLHHPRFDYSLAPAQLMSLESGPSFMTHSVENQIHLGTPVDQAALCGGGVHMNTYSLGGGGGAGMSRLPADHGLTQISQILPSKAAKTSIVTQFSPPGHNFLFGSSLTAPPVCNALKLPALNFKYNPPKVEPPQSLHFLDSSLKLFDGYTASQQSSVTDGRPLKKEKQSEFNISFRGARHAMQVDDAESPGPRDHFSKNIITGSSAMGSVLSSEHSSHASNSADSISKRPRLNDPPVTAATNLPFKVRKEKLGERITALQQLVSPFGKTDTASVLLEAIGYIKFLQEQVQLLSTPYMKNLCVSSSPHDGKQSWTADKGKAGESELSDLRSKGLCLMPISCTIHIANDNGADYWTPTIGGSSR